MLESQNLSNESKLPCTVFIVDDHPSVSAGLDVFLQGFSDFKITEIFNSSLAVIDRLHYSQPHLIICDIEMPGVNGIELCKYVKEKYPAIKFVFYTMFSRLDIIMGAIRVKPDGYLLKEMGAHELHQALLFVMEGNTFMHPKVSSLLVNKQFNGIELSQRELEVLKLFANGKTTQQTADLLFISHHTVESHRKNLISKTGVNNIAELVHWAHINGHLSGI